MGINRKSFLVARQLVRLTRASSSRYSSHRYGTGRRPRLRTWYNSWITKEAPGDITAVLVADGVTAGNRQRWEMGDGDGDGEKRGPLEVP